MDLFSKEILSYIGIIVVIIISIILVLTVLSLILVYFIFRNKVLIEKISSIFSSITLKILLFMLDLLYIPSKKIISMLGGNDNMIDIVSIDIRNMLLKNSFSAVPFEDRIIILPQCLRSLECKTSFNSIKGAQCLKCGKCKICDIAKKAEELKYKGCYIAPGGGFVRRIINEIKPKAVLGIGCPYEVNIGMLEVSNKGIPVQGITLLKTGCVETDVELNDVFRVMEYGK
ncbi:MAG: hypothetical protein DRO92_00875 [Candidatus Altiarchaeales archaeon]|nr:MAG: hypothetical protein DRO92_00875 [Candidatus Altiarchaeales archaeon]